MFIVLVGPKGSGKSHIGGVLERRLGVHFFHVEPLWMAWHAECAAAGREIDLDEGMARIHPRIRAAIARHAHLCVETTGASEAILRGLLALAPRASTLVVRVDAPLETCLARIAARDPTHQIPADEARVRQVHALSEAAELQADLRLDNGAALAEDEIVAAFSPRLAAGDGR